MLISVLDLELENIYSPQVIMTLSCQDFERQLTGSPEATVLLLLSGKQ